MGFNQRSATPLDFNTDDLLPQADSAQPHDIPTGVSPTTAKLQDWIAWLRDNGVFYSGGDVQITGALSVATDLTVSDDVTINGDLTVAGPTTLNGTLEVGGGAEIDVGLLVEGNITADGSAKLTGTQPASNADPGAHTLHTTNIPKCWAYVETNGAGGSTVHDAFNVSSVSVTGSVVRFNFARSFATAAYAAVATTGNSNDFAVVQTVNALFVDIGVYDRSTGVLNPSSNTLRIHLVVFGRHVD